MRQAVYFELVAVLSKQRCARSAQPAERAENARIPEKQTLVKNFSESQWKTIAAVVRDRIQNPRYRNKSLSSWEKTTAKYARASLLKGIFADDAANGKTLHDILGAEVNALPQVAQNLVSALKQRIAKFKNRACVSPVVEVASWNPNGLKEAVATGNRTQAACLKIAAIQKAARKGPICIQETNLSDADYEFIPQKWPYIGAAWTQAQQGLKAHGGVAILWNRTSAEAVGEPIEMIKHHMIAQKIQDGARGNVTVISVYIPPGMIARLLQEVVRQIAKIPQEQAIVMAGDFNYARRGGKGSRDEVTAKMAELRLLTAGGEECTNRHQAGDARLDDIFVRHPDTDMSRMKLVETIRFPGVNRHEHAVLKVRFEKNLYQDCKRYASLSTFERRTNGASHLAESKLQTGFRGSATRHSGMARRSRQLVPALS